MENENKNTGIKIVTGILAVLLVVAGAFAIKLYNQEKNTKAELTEEKELVLNDLKQMVTKYDAVIEERSSQEEGKIGWPEEAVVPRHQVSDPLECKIIPDANGCVVKLLPGELLIRCF